MGAPDEIPDISYARQDGSLLSRIEMEQQLRQIWTKPYWLRIKANKLLGLPKQPAFAMKETVLRHWVLDEMIRRGHVTGDLVQVNPQTHEDDNEQKQFTQRLIALIQVGQAMPPTDGEGVDMSQQPMPPPPGQQNGQMTNQFQPPAPPPMGAPQGFAPLPPPPGMPQQFGPPPQQPQFAPPGPPSQQTQQFGAPPQQQQFAPPQPPPGFPQQQAPQMSPPGFPPGMPQQQFQHPQNPPQGFPPMGPQGMPPMGPPGFPQAAPPSPAAPPQQEGGKGRGRKAAGAAPAPQAPPMAAPVPQMPQAGFQGPPPGFAPAPPMPPQSGFAPLPPPQAQAPQQSASPRLEAVCDELLKRVTALGAQVDDLVYQNKLLSMGVVATCRALYQKPGTFDFESFLKELNVPLPPR